jgi:hypothetical protein
MYKIGKVNLSLIIPLHGVDPWYNPGTFADGIKHPQVYVVPSCDIGSVLRAIGQVDLVALGNLTAMSNYCDLYAQ